jgi:hypothetical protein
VRWKQDALAQLPAAFCSVPLLLPLPLPLEWTVLLEPPQRSIAFVARVAVTLIEYLNSGNDHQ